MHIQIDPDFLGTTTIPAHQTDGFSTLEITHSYSILASSSWTFSLSGKGTVRGVYKAKHFAFGFSSIFYSPLSVPRPVNKDRYGFKYGLLDGFYLCKHFQGFYSRQPQQVILNAHYNIHCLLN